MPASRVSHALACLAGSAAVAALVVLGAATAAPPVRSVEQLDMQRFAGTWYEVSRVPNALQARCLGDATSTYRPLTDGTLRLIQRCREADDRWGVAVGRMVAIDGDPSGARLRVNYLPGWLAWWPSTHDEHWVVLLDDDYRHAVVSEPSRETLWILSRTPSLDVRTYADIVARLRAQKYPVDRLVVTPQHAGPPLPSMAARPPLMV